MANPSPYPRPAVRQRVLISTRPSGTSGRIGWREARGAGAVGGLSCHELAQRTMTEAGRELLAMLTQSDTRLRRICWREAGVSPGGGLIPDPPSRAEFQRSGPAPAHRAFVLSGGLQRIRDQARVAATTAARTTRIAGTLRRHRLGVAQRFDGSFSSRTLPLSPIRQKIRPTRSALPSVAPCILLCGSMKAFNWTVVGGVRRYSSSAGRIKSQNRENIRLLSRPGSPPN